MCTARTSGCFDLHGPRYVLLPGALPASTRWGAYLLAYAGAGVGMNFLPVLSAAVADATHAGGGRRLAGTRSV